MIQPQRTQSTQRRSSRKGTGYFLLLQKVACPLWDNDSSARKKEIGEFKAIVHGARGSLLIDRVYRGQLADMLEALP